MRRAVTFDLWNTLIYEGHGGLIRPRAKRWQAILADIGHDLELDRLEVAHERALIEYQAAWRTNQQFRSAEAVAACLRVLDLVVDEQVTGLLIESFHDAGLESALEIVPGAIEVLGRLRERGVRTAIICDIGLTPSSALCQRLEGAGVLELIDVQAWSDLLGTYKPDPGIFRWTLERLGVGVAESLHVGDRLRTDVAGARATGMASARFRGVYDDADDLPDADCVIDDLRQLLLLPARCDEGEADLGALSDEHQQPEDSKGPR